MRNQATMHSFMGFRVVVSPDRPKYQLPKDIQVTQEFREDFDRWALGFFGTTNLVPDGQMLVVHGREMVVSPRTLGQLKTQVAGKAGEHEYKSLPEDDFLGDHDMQAWKNILERRGGCRCFLSAPCNACVEPLTEDEVNAEGYTFKPWKGCRHEP